MILSASILSADFTRLAAQIQEAEQAGVDWLHIDVMDGHFVPNITMGPFILEACRRVSNLPLDVHLMIENPERYIEAFAKAGAGWISIHIENNNNVYRTLQEIHALGCKAGIALNPGTPAAAVSSVVQLVDFILVMSVNPGFSGQEFIPEMVNKVEEISNLVRDSGSSAIIEVDGGITDSTLSAMYRAGARIFVSATALFKYPDGLKAGVQALHRAV